MSFLFEDDRTPLMAQARRSSYRGPISATLYTDPSENDISFKLNRRKELLNRRRMIVNLEFIFAMIGFVCMLTVTELRIQRVYNHDHTVFLVVKLIMSLTTILLLMMIILYYNADVELLMTDKGIDDWRVIVTSSFVLKVFVQLLICAVHPIPGNIKVPYITIDGQSGKVSVDGVLSILMLLRLYIVVKFVLMHSQWMLNTSMQSIGHLNKVKTDAKFILRCLMKDRPRTMVSFIMFSIFITNSWAMRTCESYYDPDNALSSFSNSMWVVAITFLAVGYGDLSPNSYCGRFVSVDTGLMGIATTALLVTVITAKLEQTRAERYVRDFMAWVNLEKKRKNCASDIIKWSLMKWSVRGRRQVSSYQKMIYQRRLLSALQTMRNVMRKLSVMKDNAVDIVELGDGVNNVYDLVECFESKVEQNLDRRKGLDSRLKALERKLDAILDEIIDDLPPENVI